MANPNDNPQNLSKDSRYCQIESRKRYFSHTMKIWVAVFVGVTSLAVVVEILLRTILGLGSPVLFEADPKFGAFPLANQQLHRFFVDFRTNQYGMRSGPIAAKKSKGEYRILFVGDSVIYGTTYVNQNDIFVEQVGSQLRKKQLAIVVMNASSPGWAPSNELGFINERGLYGADMVVLVYNTKDLTQKFSEYHESPITPLKNPRFALGELWSRYVSPRLFLTTAQVDPGSTSDQGRPLPIDETLVMKTIEQTRQLVVGQDARFVVLYFPAYTDDVRRYQSEWDRGLTMLKRWGVEKGISVLDMTEVAKGHTIEQLYFDGIHLKPAGDRLYADAFVKWFSENQLSEIALASRR
jgi:hypothetical protein